MSTSLDPAIDGGARCYLEFRCDGQTAQLTVDGDVDDGAVGALTAQLDQLGLTDADDVVIDLTHAAGLGLGVVEAIVAFEAELLEKRRTLTVVCDRSPLAGSVIAGGVRNVEVLDSLPPSFE